MKSRRHRAIDKSNKDLPKIGFYHKRKINKKVSSDFKLNSKIYYLEMKKEIKNMSFKEIVEYYK